VRWPKLIGKARKQPRRGRWHDWKQSIADHCDGRCVYCAIPEGRFGGIRNFHIEHFRPKVRFPKLENKIHNLYLACAICNILKCDDWPAEPVADHSIAAYPDPSAVDYNTIFAVSQETYEVDSPTLAGRYLVERILLNRAQLVLERRLAAMLAFWAEFDTWVRESMDTMTRAEARQTMGILLDIGRAKTSALQVRPYGDVDTKRVKAKVGKKR
jgi:hypothetical protein